MHHWTKPGIPNMNNEAVDNPSAEPKSSTNYEAKKKIPGLAMNQYMHFFWSCLSQYPLENKQSALLRNECAHYTPSKRNY